EIAGLIEIGEESRLLRLPSQRRSGSLARGGDVHAGESGEPAEMRRCLVRGLGDDRHTEPTTDHLGDRLERDAFFGDRMIRAALDALFERQSVEAGGIEPMHAGPAVIAIADVGCAALLAREADQMRDESMIASAMGRWR